jgi:hypothetical protein
MAYFIVFGVMFIVWFLSSWYGLNPDTEDQEVWTGVVSAADEAFGYPHSDQVRNAEPNLFESDNTNPF